MSRAPFFVTAAAAVVAVVAVVSPSTLGKAVEVVSGGPSQVSAPDLGGLPGLGGLRDILSGLFVEDVPDPAAAASGAAASAQLEALQVRGVSGATGYDRDAFGQAWADVDRNGCDTRNDILARDLVDEQFRDGSDCVVVSGRLSPEPYTGRDVVFSKEAASKVQIDHVYPLSLAWQHGADRWDAEKRRRFANDPGNLVAVDGPANASKGDSSPAAWMPPNRDAWCAYSVRFVDTASTYGLSVTAADKDMLARGLAKCAG